MCLETNGGCPGNQTQFLYKSSVCSSALSRLSSPWNFYLTEKQLLFWAADPAGYEEHGTLGSCSSEGLQLHAYSGLRGFPPSHSHPRRTPQLSSPVGPPRTDGPALTGTRTSWTPLTCPPTSGIHLHRQGHLLRVEPRSFKRWIS